MCSIYPHSSLRSLPSPSNRASHFLFSLSFSFEILPPKQPLFQKNKHIPIHSRRAIPTVQQWNYYFVPEIIPGLDSCAFLGAVMVAAASDWSEERVSLLFVFIIRPLKSFRALLFESLWPWYWNIIPHSFQEAMISSLRYSHYTLIPGALWEASSKRRLYSHASIMSPFEMTFWNWIKSFIFLINCTRKWLAATQKE